MLHLSFLFLMFMTSVGFAQVVTLRSGQHADFTRLVVTMSEPKSWDFGRTTGGYAFRIRSDDARYDLSTVFTKIPRDRLSAARVDDETGILHLDIACECHAVAAPFRPGIIVIDLLDGPPPPQSPFEVALHDPGQALPVLAAAQSVVRPVRRPRNFTETAPLVIPNLQPLTQQNLPTIPPYKLVERDQQISALQGQLLKEFSSGVAAGIVSAGQPIPRRTAPLEPSVLEGPRILPIEGAANIAPTTASDPEQLRIREGDNAVAPNAEGARCVAPDMLNIASWGDLEDPYAQLAIARASIIGEFDRFDSHNLKTLLKLYIFYGFGAEARQLAGQISIERHDLGLFRALADIIDEAVTGEYFEGMATCDGPSALWSMLENPSRPVNSLSTSSIVNAFSELPLWHRQALGPKLADKLLATGENEAARAISESIRRAAGQGDHSVALIAARLELSATPTVSADYALDEIVQSSSPHAGAALSLLLESKIERGEEIDLTQVLALEAIAHEEKHTPLGPSFRRTIARSLAAADEGARAFSDYAAQAPHLYPELWEILAEKGSALTVATLAIAPPAGSLKEVSPKTRRAIAERLLDAGFPDAGLGWIEGSPGIEEDLLRAQAALMVRDGRSALRAVAGKQDQFANRIRAEAHELLGDFSQAHEAWNGLGDDPKALRALYLDRDWPALQRSVGAAYSEALPHLNPTAFEPALGELAQARGYLEASIVSRSSITGALASDLTD